MELKYTVIDALLNSTGINNQNYIPLYVHYSFDEISNTGTGISSANCVYVNGNSSSTYTITLLPSDLNQYCCYFAICADGTLLTSGYQHRLVITASSSCVSGYVYIGSSQYFITPGATINTSYKSYTNLGNSHNSSTSCAADGPHYYGRFMGTRSSPNDNYINESGNESGTVQISTNLGYDNIAGDITIYIEYYNNTTTYRSRSVRLFYSQCPMM